MFPDLLKFKWLSVLCKILRIVLKFIEINYCNNFFFTKNLIAEILTVDEFIITTH